MKKFVSILLAFIIILQCSMRAIIVINFSLNTTCIANNLCENKNKPELCCKGKCYLKKQLDKESSGNRIPKQLKEKQEQWFLLAGETVSFDAHHLIVLSRFRYILKRIINRPFSFFHPPPIF